MMQPRAGGSPLVLRCGRCGRFVDWEHARLQVLCECRAHLDLPPVLVRDASDADRRVAQELFERDFGHPVDLAVAQVLVAESEGDVAGALAWRATEGALDIVALATDPMWQRSGVGGYLLAEAELIARKQRQQQVTVTVTNDNLPALYFYQRHGYRLAALVRDAAAGNGGHATVGFAGIPIRDELRLLKALAG